MLFSWTVIPSLIGSVETIRIPLGACTGLQDSPSAQYISIWRQTPAFSASAHLCHIPVFSKFNSGPLDQLWFVIPPDYRTWAMYLLQSFIYSCKPVLNLSVPLAT